MSDTKLDAIVIGAGSAGLSFARHAAANGARVALIERGDLGGTCVNRGCVPKKLMWTVAHTLDQARQLAEQGVLESAPAANIKALQAKSATHIENIRNNLAQDMNDAGVILRCGDARITGRNTVMVGTDELCAAHIVLAVGGRPMRPDIPGADLAATSDDLWEWQSLPRELIIIGAGYIGCEIAAIMAAMGVAVTLISDENGVLTEFSQPMQKLAMDNLVAQGVTVHTDTRPDAIAADDGGLVVRGPDGFEVRGERVLFATGRETNLESLGDLKDDIAITDSGQIDIGDDFATSVDGIYALGDCGTRLPLTPVARDDGRVLAMNLFADGADPVSPDHIATTAFLLPPLAEVGQVDTICHSGRFEPLKAGLTDDGRKHAWHFGKQDETITAIGLAGYGAAEAAGFMAHLVATKATLKSADLLLPVHPTSSEEWYSGVRS